MLIIFYTIGDPEEPATGTANSLVHVPTEIAGSLLSEGSTEMMANSVLFSEVPTGMADSVFSEAPTETAKLQLSEVPTGMVDPLSSEGHTGMADSQVLLVRVYMYMFSVAQLDTRRNPKFA